MKTTRNKILFLNLYTFSLTGGIEKVNRNFSYALGQLFNIDNYKIYSLYDNFRDLDTNYIPTNNFKAFKGNKILFILTSLGIGISSEKIILSHINLLIVAKLISLFQPKKEIILLAHGIEVWSDISDWKINFIKKHVKIWAVSNFTKQKMIQNYGISASQIHLLNNCLSPFVDEDLAYKKPSNLIEKYNLDTERTILYTLTRLASTEKYKGYDTVISVLADLKKEGYNFYYLLAGKADELESKRIKELIKIYNLTDEVNLLGYIPETELKEYFLLADVFIMPSSGEGFGLVFIEAAACGCQVIGGNADGSVDALLQGELGQMVNPTDEEEIKQAIISAMQNRNHHPKKQQELAIANFGFEQYVAKLKKLLN